MRALAGIATSVVLAAALGLAASAQEPAASADDVRAKIAAVELDAAKDALAPLKAAAKTAAEKAEVKELEKQLALGRQVDAAAKKVAKLVADGKPRDAYALAVATGDQLEGAIALAALRKAASEARKAAFEDLHDFDGIELAVGSRMELTGKIRGLGYALNSATGEIVADPLGGKAIRWAGGGTKKQHNFVLTFGREIDLAAFEYATVRIRCAQAPPGQAVRLELRSSTGTGSDLFRGGLNLKGGGKWQEVRVPLGTMEKKGNADASRVTGIGIFFQGPDAWEADVDDLMLARKAAK